MNQTKKICVTFLLAVSLAALTGCGSTEDESSIILASDIIESYDSESQIDIDGQEETSSENNEMQGITVKDKMYTFDGNDLVILRLENHTKNNYTITIEGKYLDASGQLLRTETKVLKGLGATDSSQMLFMPEIPFNRFSYTVSVKEHDSTYLQSKVKGLDWNEDTAQFNARYGYYTGGEPEKSHMLFTKFYYLNDNEADLYVTGKVFLFDKNDQILHIKSMGYVRTAPHETGGNDLMFYSSAETKLTTDKTTWPEQYREGLTMLFIPTDVMTYDELPDGFFS